MSEPHSGGRAWRVGVLSDTHRDTRAIAMVMERLQREEPLDALCFLGDCAADMPRIEKRLLLHGGEPTRIYAVRGNNDFHSELPDECLLFIGGMRILCVHGHLQRVKQHRLQLLLYARETGADIALFGHTHQAECGYEQGILLLNPGAATGTAPTCALLTLRDGRVDPQLISLADRK